METNILTESRFEINGRHINFAKGPENGSPLLLIHGISGRWQDWNSVSEAFAADWQVYAVDLRGHGKSTWTAEGYHWRLYSEDQVEFLERVIGEPAHVTGHSLGGMTALGINALRFRFSPGGCVRGPTSIHASPLGGQSFPQLVYRNARGSRH